MNNQFFLKENFSSLTERLFATSFYGMKLDLENITRLCEAFQNPEKRFKSILVTGTNGKGSVSLKIAKALELSGYHTGLYTSPHISCFRERIKLNSHLISEEDVIELLSKIFEVTYQKKIPATFFEILTILGFLFFNKKEADFAVLEIGIGGRLDATNIVLPVLSVITSVSLDHTGVLGATLEAIAREKSGIIKSHVPVILGPYANQNVFFEVAREKEAPLTKIENQSFDFFDVENQKIAKAALQELSKQHPIKDSAIEEALLMRPSCRFEVLKPTFYPSWIKQTPAAIILDVAHNPAGLERLFEAVSLFYPHHLIRVVAGFSADKDVKKCLEIISQKAVQIHLIRAKHPRSAEVSDLSRILLSEGIKSFTHSEIDEGVKQAVELSALNQEILVICGSFFIMTDVRSCLGIIEPRDHTL